MAPYKFLASSGTEACPSGHFAARYKQVFGNSRVMESEPLSSSNLAWLTAKLSVRGFVTELRVAPNSIVRRLFLNMLTASFC